MPFEARGFYKNSLTRRGVEKQLEKQHIFTPDPEQNEDDDLDNDNEDDIQQDPQFQIDEECLDPASDSSASKDEHVQAARKTVKAKDNGKANVRWRHMKPVTVDSSISGAAFPTPPDEIPSPVEYFYSLFERKLMSHVAEQTNLYSVQCIGRSIQTDEKEIEQFLGILIMMGVINYPQYRMYWSPETRIPLIADTIRLTRFENLKRFLHFNDNSQITGNRDDIYIANTKYDSILSKCRNIPPEESHSIDEQMIPTKCMSALR
ncbi:piggyBac transposable element-derived protein 2-like [Rhopilema esculentum]|uniref:piggyBac transposable element-derived protein 2-like n=1 Tax=Rhopilema esculentum TaxID=499914 RepID=UPI0031DFE4D3